MSASAFLKTITARRTHYALKNTLPEGVTIDNVQSIVQDIVKYTPTSFNSQSIRAIIITGELHKKVWDQVVNAIEGDSGKKRPTSIRDEAYGSVIFAIDSDVTKKFQEQFAFIASLFPDFDLTSNGAAQINSWAALQEIGLGGHLQHYNAAVKAALGDKIPESWNVEAQLVFGTPVSQPYEKTFIENEVKVLDQ
ncbi:hypothetical protein BN7_6547 [Wickerhamomyces ciferrii]|uniref:Nitroreductase domain-containing protein n=1 Tax=Wickerhamomyces ciferrii (strain ATCC 14091 / BCRC 22168 / CBS 111 / JCM 3599 / NBRC 0793 / NRRL Y-1031 F-60-10) TaxID=1206466 RepID=K0KUR3_WICCF|nr:uncharacterized protein BN7_6547 [Wickerhamomyces ciferrii]CCH46941.1 hypothetical protein BN7_6547 [Wickerhamomyces ciferrii]